MNDQASVDRVAQMAAYSRAARYRAQVMRADMETRRARMLDLCSRSDALVQYQLSKSLEAAGPPRAWRRTSQAE